MVKMEGATKNTFLAVVHIKNITAMNIKRQLPDWENRYQQVELDLLPWFYPDLDPDIEQALADLSIQTGKVLGCRNMAFFIVFDDLVYGC